MSVFFSRMPLMDTRSEMKASKNNDANTQRSGYQVDPYSGAYPMMGNTVSYPNPNDGLGLRLFGMGLIRPFTQFINGGIRTVSFMTSSVNNAFLTLLGAGGVALLIKSFKDKAALRPTAGLAALAAAVYFGVKTLVKGFSGQDTTLYDGGWQYRLGTTLSYGVGAVALLALHKGNIGTKIKASGSKVWDGLANIWPTTKKIVDNIFTKFK